MLRSILLALFLLAILPRPAAAAPDAGAHFPRTQLQRFAAHLARRDGLNRVRMLRILEQARPQPDIIAMMNRPAEQVLKWWQYRRIFLTPARIAAGAAFWQAHREALDRIGAEQGVDPRYIVAILGVETYYGHLTGTFRVLDALSTLAFDYPARSRFFKLQLERFLVLTQRDGLDPLTVKGSYAGAMGPLQFMPSTYLRFAVGTGSAPPNLFTNWDDIFASVAHYLRAHGWQPGAPVLSRVRIEPGARFDVNPDSLALDRTVGSLAAQGVEVERPEPAGTPVVLLLAHTRSGPIYRVGFNNFHALLTYNYSKLYAMAVDGLARAIARHLPDSSGPAPLAAAVHPPHKPAARLGRPR